MKTLREPIAGMLSPPGLESTQDTRCSAQVQAGLSISKQASRQPVSVIGLMKDPRQASRQLRDRAYNCMQSEQVNSACRSSQGSGSLSQTPL